MYSIYPFSCCCPAVLYIFGGRNATYLPYRFTCEVVSDSQLSAYGYPIVETYESTDRKFTAKDANMHIIMIIFC